MAKDSPRTTAGELQKIVESRGQKTLKKKKVKQHLHPGAEPGGGQGWPWPPLT